MIKQIYLTFLINCFLQVHFANNNRMYAGSEMPECERGYQTLDPMSKLTKMFVKSINIFVVCKVLILFNLLIN